MSRGFSEQIIGVVRRTTPTLRFEFTRKGTKVPFSLDGVDFVKMFVKRLTTDEDKDALFNKTLTVIPPDSDGIAMVKLTLTDTGEDGEFFADVKAVSDGGATVISLEQFTLHVGDTAYNVT